MIKRTIDKVIEIAESLGWSITIDGNEFEFRKYSPAGQDFSLTITVDDMDELVEELSERYDNFDVSEETYLWLDSTGHGKNGAPYDMKDLYEDMEACERMILELHNALESL